MARKNKKLKLFSTAVVTKSHLHHSLEVGEIVWVIKVDFHESDLPYRVMTRRRLIQWVQADHLKPYKE